MGKDLVLIQLKRRVWNLLNRCYMCKRKEKIIDHMLMHYSQARILWQLVFSFWSYLGNDSVRGTLLSLHGSWGRSGKKWKKAWWAAPLCIFWMLRMERNRRSSEDTKQLDHAIKSSFMCVFVWIGLDCT